MLENEIDENFTKAFRICTEDLSKMLIKSITKNFPGEKYKDELVMSILTFILVKCAIANVDDIESAEKVLNLTISGLVGGYMIILSNKLGKEFDIEMFKKEINSYRKEETLH